MRVYYEDTDLAGIVYHANYLKFAERGRTEALIAAGIDQAALRDGSGIVFAVRRVEAEFLAPARFQDLLVVRTGVTEVGGARIRLLQEVGRPVMGPDERPVVGDADMLFRAAVEVVCLGADGRPRRVPETVRAALGPLRDG